MSPYSSFEAFVLDAFPIEDLHTVIGGIEAEEYVQMDEEERKVDKEEDINHHGRIQE